MTKPLVEIVTHAYAVEHRHYAAALCYQLSSLVLHPPKDCVVRTTVCYCDEDWAVKNVLKFFADHLDLRHWIASDRYRLGRRCIGRSSVAGYTLADFVWFADVDQVWDGSCFDRLVAMPWPSGASMIYPKTIKIHRDHATGDAALAKVDLDNPRLIDVDPSEFIDKGYNRAIGGVQIVRGNFARQYGYLNGDPAWQQPAAKPFGDFRDDVAYRTFCWTKGPIVGVDLPGMLRLRHSTTSYQGPTLEKKKSQTEGYFDLIRGKENGNAIQEIRR